MLSELQKQVNLLKSKQLNVEPIHKGRPSLFLSPKEASGVDIEDIYSSAFSALQSLSQYDNRFIEYQTTLLHPSTLHLRRELKTAAENAELDQQLNSILNHLTLFAELHATHQILEYLIRRYRIHELCTDSFLLCLIPIHDSKVFARAVQMCVLPTPSKWIFLDGVKRSGVPLPRSLLVTECIKSSALLLTLSSFTLLIIELASEAKRPGSLVAGANAVVTLYTTIVVDLIAAKAMTFEPSLTDSQLRAISRYLLPGVQCYTQHYPRSCAPQSIYSTWRKSSFVIIARMIPNTKFSESLLEFLTNSIISTAHKSLEDILFSQFDDESVYFESFHCLMVISQFQTNIKFSETCVRALIERFNYFISALASCTERGISVHSLVDAFCRSVIGLLLFTTTQGPAGIVNLPFDDIAKAFEQLLIRQHISNRTVHSIIQIVFTELTNSRDKISTLDSLQMKSLCSVLASISRHVPEDFDRVIKLISMELSTDHDCKASFQRILELVCIDSPFGLPVEGDMSLLLLLDSPSVEIRVKALQRFVSFVPAESENITADLKGISDAVCRRLLDYEFSVASVAWQLDIINRIVKYSGPNTLLKIIFQAFNYWFDYSNKCDLKSALQIISCIYSSLTNSSVLSVLQSESVHLSNNISASNFTGAIACTLKGADLLLLMLYLAPSFASMFGSTDKLASTESKYFMNAALKASSLLADLVPMLTRIKSFICVSNSEGDYRAILVECLSESLISSDNTECIRILYSWSQLAHHCISTEPTHPWASSISSILLGLHKHLLKLADVSIRADACKTAIFMNFAIFSPVLARALNNFEDKSNHWIIQILQELFDAGPIEPFKPFPVQIPTPIYSYDCRMRLLVSLLANPIEDISALIVPCLAALYPDNATTGSNSKSLANAVSSLLRVAAAAETESLALGRIHSYDSMPFIPLDLLEDFSASLTSCNYLFVTKSARITGLRCLASWLQAITSDPKAVEEHTHLLFVTSAVMIATCTDADSVIRRAGLSVAIIFGGMLATNVTIEIPSLNKKHSSAFKLSQLVHVAKTFEMAFSQIADDATAAISLLQASITNNQESAGYLLETAHFYSVEHLVPYLSDSLLQAACNSSLDIAWPTLRNVLTRLSQIDINTDQLSSCFQITKNIILSISKSPKASPGTQEDVFNAIAEIFELQTNKKGTLLLQIQSNLSEVITPNWLDSIYLDSSLKTRLFNRLLTLHISGCHQVNLGLILIGLSIDIVQVTQSFKFHCVLEQQLLDSLEFEPAMARLCRQIDKIADIILATLNATTSSDSLPLLNVEIDARCSAIVELLQFVFEIIKKLKDPRLDGTFDFTRISCLDIIRTIFVKHHNLLSSYMAGKIAVPPHTKQPKRKMKAIESCSVTISSLTIEEFRSNIKLTLDLLEVSQCLQAQSAALAVLHEMIPFVDFECMLSAVASLGNLLAHTASLEETVGKNILIRQLLSTCNISHSKNFQDLPEYEDSVSSIALSQKVVQSLLLHCEDINLDSRDQLVTIALDSMGPISLPGCVLTLIAHLYANYFCDEIQHTNENKGEDVMVLLSIAAQKKARKQLSTSLPEELLRLAISCTQTQTLDTQIFNLIALVLTAHSLFKSVTTSSIENRGEEDQLRKCYPKPIYVALPDGKSLCVDPKALNEYASELIYTRTMNSDAMSELRIDSSQCTVSLGMLILQCVFEMIESKGFSEPIFSIQSDKSKDNTISSALLSLADELLQLHAFATQVQSMFSSHRYISDENTYLSVAIGGNIARITKPALGKTVASSCFDILQNLQKLLDTPTFFAIFQELLNHDETAVRHSAYQILGNRLESITLQTTIDKAEHSLYVDLLSQLQANTNSLLLNSQSDQHESLSASQRISLAQSAAMCIDRLAKHCGDASSKLLQNSNRSYQQHWEKSLSSALNNTLQLAISLNHCIIKHNIRSSSSNLSSALPPPSSLHTLIIKGADDADISKILGSLLLLGGTLCSTLGSKCLPQLAGLMHCLIESYDSQRLSLKALNFSSITSLKLRGIVRVKLLLMRSILSSVSAIFQGVPAFCHPYLSNLLASIMPTFALNYVPDSTQLLESIAFTMPSVILKIQSRLAIPALLSVLGNLMCEGHSTAAATAKLLEQIYGGLERADILSQLGDLCATAVLLMDYRRVFGDNSLESETVESAVTEAVVKLSVKLTESELRALLSRLSEWKDTELCIIENENENKNDEIKQTSDPRYYSRIVSFYAVLSSLGIKLKVIFTPLAAPFWDHIADSLKVFSNHVNVSYSEVLSKLTGVRQAKKKARKSENVSSHISLVENVEKAVQIVSNDRLTVELIALVKGVLGTVTSMCTYDTEGFVDEHTYEVMCPAVVSLLTLRAAFPSDEEYLTFCEGSLGNALASLACAVGQDLHWKSLNHKVLLACRDTRQSVRQAATATLHKLFNEVGEEYLALLPECLPFLSELLEDDHEAVVTRASELSQLIEMLSGESIQTYLT